MKISLTKIVNLGEVENIRIMSTHTTMVLQAKLYLHILFYCTALHLNATLMFYSKQTGDLEKLASVLLCVAVLCHQVNRQRQINCGKSVLRYILILILFQQVLQIKNQTKFAGKTFSANNMNQFSWAPASYFLLQCQLSTWHDKF